MVRTNQRGSVLGFVAIGVVMALLLIGGAYVVRHNLEPIATNSPVAVTDEKGQPSSQEDKTADQPSEDTTDETTKDESVESAPDNSPSQTNDSTPSGQTSVEAGSTEHLPETGMGDVLLSSLFVGSFAGIAFVYLRSRSLPSSL